VTKVGLKNASEKSRGFAMCDLHTGTVIYLLCVFTLVS
jgi:hypothetical protein